VDPRFISFSDRVAGYPKRACFAAGMLLRPPIFGVSVCKAGEALLADAGNKMKKSVGGGIGATNGGRA
jgi:hypothetical protein